MVVVIGLGFAFGAADAGAAGEAVLTRPDERPTMTLDGLLTVIRCEHGRTESS